MSDYNDFIIVLVILSIGVAAFIFAKEIREFLPKHALRCFIGALTSGAIILYLSWDTCNHENTRNILFLFGGIGAFIGIAVAVERQRTFSKQIDIAQEQLLNDRLVKGLELLDNKNVAMRKTGVKILADLAKPAADDQKSLIKEIIYDFVVSNSQKRYVKGKHKLTSAKDRLDRVDIELGIEVVFGKITPQPYGLVSLNLGRQLMKYLNSIKSFNSELEDSKFPLVNLDLRELNLRNLDFADAKLENTNLSNADLSGADLSGANLSGADLSGVDLRRVKGLTPSQLGSIIYDPNNPPKNLP